MSNLIIFDLDGVITSEDAYWDTAGLVLHELLYSPRYWNLDPNRLGPDGHYVPVTTAEESRRISRAIFPESDIVALKARAVNSNWDTCYAAVCLHLIAVLRTLPDRAALLPLQPWNADGLAAFRRQVADVRTGNQPAPTPHPPGHPPGVSLLYHEWPAATQKQGEALPYIVGTPLAGVLGVGTGGTMELYTIDIAHILDSPIFRDVVGFELINRFDAYASEVLGFPVENVFSRYSPFWTFCQDIFQEWYLGDELYAQSYGHAPAQRGKPGCIHFEQPLLPLEQVRTTLEELRRQGYIPGVATGRPEQEALVPLKLYGLLPYFDEQHIATSGDVERAEAVLRAHGDATLLNKPHPFIFSFAADHNHVGAQFRAPDTRTVAEDGRIHPTPSGGSLGARDGMNCAPTSTVGETSDLRHQDFIVVGDSTGDILGGRAAGALTVAVLTGARTAEARELLAQSEPDFTIQDVTKLPELLREIDSLATIQRLQFTEREKAERLLQRWFARHMNLATARVTLTPKAVSLNSFNGFYQVGSEEYFFKTHVEEQGVLQEYYHAELLHQAGYNIVLPLRTLHEEGRQMVIYPVVYWPWMFDLIRAIETGAGNTENISQETLVAAERRECERLLSIYRTTLAPSTAAENARAPIHQLFWHRLASGRLQSFYGGKPVTLPGDGNAQEAVSSIPFDELLQYRWIINGVPQQQTLGELIERALSVLHPEQVAMTVMGHGDAHLGNVFLEHEREYLYFDPAFAGRHTPLLDIVKPLYHNVFATWMYFSHDVARDLHMTVSTHSSAVWVEHDYVLTPLRRAMLQAKVEYLIQPLIAELRSQDALLENWQEIVRLALMCCPLLTINLLDERRIPAAISWLGLSQALQLGNSGIEPWRTGK